MQKVVTVLRSLLGLLLLVFGLNGFFHFIPLPEHTAAADSFLGALVDSGYLMTLVKATEIFCGLTLISGIFTPLGLVVLAPITVNILAFHVMLDRSGLGMAVGITVLHLWCAWGYRASFKSVLQPRAAIC